MERVGAITNTYHKKVVDTPDVKKEGGEKIGRRLGKELFSRERERVSGERKKA